MHPPFPDTLVGNRTFGHVIKVFVACQSGRATKPEGWGKKILTLTVEAIEEDEVKMPNDTRSSDTYRYSAVPSESILSQAFPSQYKKRKQLRKRGLSGQWNLSWQTSGRKHQSTTILGGPLRLQNDEEEKGQGFRRRGKWRKIATRRKHRHWIDDFITIILKEG